jgi:hypothetical protein
MKTESDLKATLEDKTEQLEKQQVHIIFFWNHYVMAKRVQHDKTTSWQGFILCTNLTEIKIDQKKKNWEDIYWKTTWSLCYNQVKEKNASNRNVSHTDPTIPLHYLSMFIAIS